MWRRLLIAVVVLFVLVGGWFLWLLNAAGELKALTAHFEGTCSPVSGVIGAEDVTIHPRTGMAYLSAYDRRVPVGRPARGAIYAYDLNAPSAQVVNVTPDAAPDFRPHGISLYVAPDGASMLFVINHAGDRHTIEVYDVGEGHLAHRRTISDPLLVHPNDLVAVTPTEVYVTQRPSLPVRHHAHVRGLFPPAARQCRDVGWEHVPSSCRRHSPRERHQPESRSKHGLRRLNHRAVSAFTTEMRPPARSPSVARSQMKLPG
jgi:hypothetical protein